MLFFGMPRLRALLGVASGRRLDRLPLPAAQLLPRRHELAGLGLRLRYLSGGMSAAARLVGGRVIPERAGYYLGYRMAEALVGSAGLAEALRAPVADFQVADDVSRGIQTA